MYTKLELEQFVKQAKQYARYGKVADYIPALGKANPNDLSIAIYTPDGSVIDAGDTTDKVTLQSISKIIALALVLTDHGEKSVPKGWHGADGRSVSLDCETGRSTTSQTA